MSRFHIGDRVLLLAKYANLYPAIQGVVRTANPNPIRELFDEFSVQFSDGSIQTVHAFQAVEDLSAWPALRATLSREAPSVPSHTRGATPWNRTVFVALPFEIDMEVGERNGHLAVVGQVTEKNLKGPPSNTEVRLINQEQPVDWTVASDLGEFEFSDIPTGTDGIEILCRDSQQRIVIKIPGLNR